MSDDDLAVVLNAGSSSVKMQLVEPVSGERRAAATIERIGEPVGAVTVETVGHHQRTERAIPDHSAAIEAVVTGLADVGVDLRTEPVAVVGHRVVHGGSRFSEPTVIDDDVVATIEELSVLAPLHNPPAVLGIRGARATFPAVPQVAVFDTAFFASLPPGASTYAIDRAVTAEHGIRRYGFHGTSHRFVSREVARILDRPYDEVDQIVLHLGNGASASAIRGGRAVDTSMGMTPLEGLVMGTRSGDVDPGALLHLLRHHTDVDGLDELLNRRSGLVGLSGVNDFRELDRLVASGDPDARLALDVYVHRLRHYVGAYAAVLGHVDAIAFTGGVGENAAGVRAAVCETLGVIGVELDPERNAAANAPGVVSSDASAVAVLVVPTNEELSIARQAVDLVAR